MLKTKPAAGLCLCVFVLIVHEALAQDAVSLPTIEHSALIDTRPNEPIRIFGMRLPFRITPIAGPSEIAFDAHFGNTWNPSGLLEYQQADEPYFSKPWEATYHPPYEEVPDRYQFYSADGVIRSAALTWTRKISNRHEFYGALNANMLVGGDSFIDAA
ncbi:MAG TPA: hypothetical protein VEB86_17400, partial [Chryseosolibacter sp.]|nr:hypothetical protein [Chryseosolibacter sp.]